MNKGKNFESDFQTSAKNDGILAIRLNDTSLSWLHEKGARFTPKNISDFLVFKKPNLLAVENKSTTYKSISIQTTPSEDDNKMIKFSQINSLVNISLTEGVYAGFLLNFRNDDDVRDNIVYWLSIQKFCDFLIKSEKKSINKEDCINYGGFEVKGVLKRTRYLYDVKKMVEDVVRDGDEYAESRKEAIQNGWSLQQEFFS